MRLERAPQTKAGLPSKEPAQLRLGPLTDNTDEERQLNDVDQPTEPGGAQNLLIAESFTLLDFVIRRRLQESAEAILQSTPSHVRGPLLKVTLKRLGKWPSHYHVLSLPLNSVQ